MLKATSQRKRLIPKNLDVLQDMAQVVNRPQVRPVATYEGWPSLNSTLHSKYGFQAIEWDPLLENELVYLHEMKRQAPEDEKVLIDTWIVKVQEALAAGRQ